MKKIRRHLSIFATLSILIGLLVLVVSAVSVQQALQPASLIVSYAAPPDVTARSVLVVDEASGRVIYSKQPAVARPIASVTKLFSSALFLARNDPSATTTITWSDVASEGRAGRLEAGQHYTNHDLLFPALLESSNDAATAMARIDPGLINALNFFASTTDATKTHFVDASGLSPENVASAADLYRMFTKVRTTTPHIIDITRLHTYLNHINAWMNNNPFNNDPTYLGGKHGYTDAADRTLIARFAEPVGGTTRTIDYILLHSDDLTGDVATLRSFVHAAVSYR